MDDRDFLDHLYQLWSKTPGASDRYWEPVEYTDRTNRYRIYAVTQDGDRKLIASEVQSEAADFITGIHGCLPDLVRRLHSALDEADRADFEKDSRECRIAELELELAELKADLGGLLG